MTGPSDESLPLSTISAALAIILVEAVTVLSESAEQADERLEEIASRLISFDEGDTLTDANLTKRLLLAVGRDLISSEGPAQSGD